MMVENDCSDGQIGARDHGRVVTEERKTRMHGMMKTSATKKLAVCGKKAHVEVVETTMNSQLDSRSTPAPAASLPYPVSIIVALCECNMGDGRLL